VPKQDFFFRAPILNASGCLGFYSPTGISFNLTELGAFITNPISIKPRKPASQACLIHYPGGVLLHSGFPNPGFKTSIRKYVGRWQCADIPIIVHLLGEPTAELASAVRQLEELENVIGLEIGLADDISVDQAIQIIQLAQGELPLMVRLPMQRVCEMAGAVIKTGASLISLAPGRGTLSTAGGASISGRLYGPSLFPLALQTVQTLSVRGIPVVGAGGIYQRSQIAGMLNAGAIAVQIDTALWRGGWEIEPVIEQKAHS
jgi:dihydroorotate dehydrogenase (NAD+) catalytic subunit